MDFAVLLFASLYGLSGVGAGDLSSVFYGVNRMVLILFWFPAVGVFSQKLWRKRATVTIRISAFICGCMGVFQYFFTDMELLWVDVTRFSDIGGRVCGPFANPNIFAVYLLLSLFIFVETVMDENSGLVSRVLNGFGCSVCTLSLILTWSRGAWLGFIAGIIIWILFFHPQTFAFLFLGIPMAFFALPHLPHNIVNRFLSIGSMSESSIRYRLYTWRGVFFMMKENPWGIGASPLLFSKLYRNYAVSGTETVVHTHQLLLQICVETGFVGLLCFAFFLLLLILYFAVGCAERKTRGRCGMFSAFSGIAAVLVMGMFDYVWYHFGMLLLFFTVCAYYSCFFFKKEKIYEKKEGNFHEI